VGEETPGKAAAKTSQNGIDRREEILKEEAGSAMGTHD